MNKNIDINSDQYWDLRFSTDWDENSGMEQSRFFAKIAFNNVPEWLIQTIRKNKYTVADWGCAQGDGTDVLRDFFDASQLTGIDFSEVAIETATSRYPAIKFKHENWLDSSIELSRYDVVFSSNTLEHFHDSFSVLNKIANYANKLVVLALPYRESERIPEHFSSFYSENIPVSIPEDFILISSSVIDCKVLAESYWPGEQVVLVYANYSWLKNQSLVLSDISIETDDVEFITESIRANFEKIISDSQLENAIKLQDVINNAQLANAAAEIELSGKWKEQMHQLEVEHAKQFAERDLIIKQLLDDRNRLSWRIGSKLRRVFNFTKSTTFALLKSMYKLMPFKIKAKLRNSEIINKIVRSIMNSPLHVAASDMIISNGGVRESYDNLLPYLIPSACPDVLFFGVIDWHLRFQRPQQLAIGFAKMNHRVFYISSELRDASEPGFSFEKIGDEGQVYQLWLHVKGAKSIYLALADESLQNQINLSIGLVHQWLGYTQSLSIVQHPFWTRAAQSVPKSSLIYDCMDHHAGFENTAKEIADEENLLMQISDLVVVTSSWLEDVATKWNRNVAVVRNAGDYHHFSSKPTKIYKDSKGRKILGYYGAIAEWFDVDLVKELADSFPDALILLIGADTANVQSKLSDCNNIQFIGEVPYSELPFYLYSFDVCLLPFKVIELTLATNPVKVYEYLGAGLPVVSVELPEIKQFDSLVYTAKNATEFIEQCGAALFELAPSALYEKRRNFASIQTWSARANEFSVALQKLNKPRVSVIVLTYNNLHLTKRCLESVVNSDLRVEIELIIVDNLSTDGTQIYLEDFAKKNPDVKLILNSDNKGFAAGNNDGLALARGDYITILNNDTVVTPGWAMALVRHFQTDPTIGLIGPVTNNIGNEAKIEINYSSLEMMPIVARQYTTQHLGQKLQIRTPAFFCVMMPRKIYELVGGLDEAFGLGFFEDDDYCRRVEQAGFKCFCVDDVFVHHNLSASFNKLGTKKKQALMEANLAIYEKKWGKWESHSYRANGGIK
ncbi:glycosyltransferase [uncultured Deefgea sp.]|uniref:glycosyltransferase n=1 Tax=uncultured Deefgea sp. TaxID=1304914 RepID=UPI002593992C|nr:glycosyltransferase [uncultured Deefgea sp.]